jgi:hypothetical protein
MAISRLRGVEAPWTEQPQEYVELKQGLLEAAYQGWVTPRRALGSSAPTVFSAAPAVGVGMLVTSLTGSGGHIAMPTVAGTGAWTYLVYGIRRASGAGAIMTMAEAPGSASYDRALNVGSDNVLRAYIFDGAPKEAASALTVAVGDAFCAALVCTGASMTVYMNGVAGTPVATSNAGFNGYTTPELVFGYGGGAGGSFGGSSTLAGGFDLAYGVRVERALPAALLEYLGRNPWELFEPRRLWLPMISAGGAAPTLSDLKAANITSSSVQFTYDYAF